MPVIETRTEHHMSTPRIIIAAILATLLIIAAVMLYNKNKTAEAPAQSTTQTQPNNAENTPPTGSVTQDGNETSDTRRQAHPAQATTSSPILLPALNSI